MRLLAVLLLLTISHPAWARDEQAARHRLCAGLAQERILRVNGARVDCISDAHAIKLGYSDQWAMVLGNALYGASQSGRMPAIILLCAAGNDRACLNHSIRLRAALAVAGTRLTLWECRESAASLEECLRLEIGDRPPVRETAQ